MIYIPFISTIFIFLVSILGTWLAFWIYFTDKKNKINQLFLLFTIAMILYLVFSYLSHQPHQSHMAIVWKKLFFASIALFLIFTYFFSVYFPRKEKIYPFIGRFIIISETIFLFLILFTDFLVKDIKVWAWGTDVIWGPGKIIWFITMIIFTFIIVGQMVKKYFILSFRRKLQTQYFLIGIIIFATSNFIFNMFFPIFFNTYKYHYFGDYSAIFLLGFTAFAIARRELFGIRVVMTALLVGLIAVLLLLDLLIFSEIFWVRIAKAFILISFLGLGYSLIKSVLLEIKRREELENLTFQLETANVKLTSAYKKLEILDKAKSEFVSIASHQLRTPLTAIKGYLSMVLEESYGKLSKKMKKPLDGIYSSNERLIKLVNDLLSVSRIEAGKIELEPEQALIEEIIFEIIEELKVATDKKKIYLKFEKPKKPLPKISVDKDKLRQVIMNIIDNAIRYTEKGGIVIKCKIEKSKCKIEITDTGEGMTKEEMDKLFESFSRGKAGTRFWTEGAGLGLYIARKFIEMHQGKIWVESEGKSKGSTFYIELPAKNV